MHDVIKKNLFRVMSVGFVSLQKKYIDGMKYDTEIFQQ